VLTSTFTVEAAARTPQQRGGTFLMKPVERTPNELKDLLAAMLSSAATPEQIAELGEMAQENDLPDTPDEDTGPINEDAAKRLRKWILDRAVAKAKANLLRPRNRSTQH
jgi:hypothetical protein